MDTSCKTCKYGIFCPTWGEYKMNIDKLRARYPDGFDPELSKHRKDGDI